MMTFRDQTNEFRQIYLQSNVPNSKAFLTNSQRKVPTLSQNNLKKNGQVRVYIDYRNLNLVTPKDKYSMSVADMLVDAAANHAILIFMDGYSVEAIVEETVQPRDRTLRGIERAETHKQSAKSKAMYLQGLQLTSSHLLISIVCTRATT